MSPASHSRPRADGSSRTVKPQAKTAERREAVLNAATRVFSARGYNSASLNEIADIVGMTHAGVLHHFGSKEQLLISVLEFRDGKSNGAIVRPHPEGAALLQHIISTVTQNTADAASVQAFTLLSAESVADGHPAQAYFRSRYAGLKASLAAALAEVSGRRADEPEVTDAAAILIATMDGLQIQWLLDPESVTMVRSLESLISALVSSLTLEAPATAKE